VITLHNLAYHGWTGLADMGQLGLRAGEPLAGANPDGIDLLLTAIERSEIRRVGSETVVRVDVRIIAATRRDLDKLVQDQRFRDDLWDRPTTRRSPRRTRAMPWPRRGAGATC
jgi:sigma54-dependent transcription regulator